MYTFHELFPRKNNNFVDLLVDKEVLVYAYPNMQLTKFLMGTLEKEE